MSKRFANAKASGDLLRDISVGELVSDFYGKARDDLLLGPVFEAAIGESDEAGQGYKKTLCLFWSSFLQGTGACRVDPLAAHLSLPELGPDYFRQACKSIGAGGRNRTDTPLGTGF